MKFLNILHSTSEGHNVNGIFEEIFLHGILDTLKIIPFLFLTYLLMEFIEHKAEGRLEAFLYKTGKFGPGAASLLGAIPQCGFSSVASNLYTGRIITLGTMIAVFLSTSDEMLPILTYGSFSAKLIFGVIIYKILVSALAGFAIDLVLRLTRHNNQKISIDELCENDGCHCEHGVFRSALHHTLSISIFILLVTWIINTLVYFIGESTLVNLLYDRPIISHLLASLVGLIPNCAVSVALTGFFRDGFITIGTMLSGLFSGAGIGLLILFRVNKHLKENLIVAGILVAIGFTFGFIADLAGLEALLT